MQPMKGDDMNEKPGHKESQMVIRTPLAHNLKIKKSLNRLEPLNTLRSALERPNQAAN